jgi:hypothetical protein
MAFMTFVSRSDRTTLVAGSGKVERPKLIGATEAQDELSSILDGCSLKAW